MIQRQFSGRFLDDFPATAGLLLVIVAVFILEVILHQKLPDHDLNQILSFAGIDGKVLRVLGSCSLSEVQQGEIWRVVASIFLHGGLIHLILNGIALADMGRVCEPILGTERFLTVYVASGLLGNGASLGYKYYSHQAMVGSVGASGALMGLMGLLFGFSLRHRDRELRDQLLHSIVYMAIMSITLSGIMDHGGHIGGFLTGMAFGFFTPRYTSSEAARRWRIPCWIAIAIGAAGLGFSFWNQFRLMGQ